MHKQSKVLNCSLEENLFFTSHRAHVAESQTKDLIISWFNYSKKNQFPDLRDLKKDLYSIDFEKGSIYVRTLNPQISQSSISTEDVVSSQLPEDVVPFCTFKYCPFCLWLRKNNLQQLLNKKWLYLDWRLSSS